MPAYQERRAMRKLTAGITFSFTQRYLPTKRHSVERRREMVTCREINFKVAESDEEFPVAMVVTDYGSIYYGAKSYDELVQRMRSSDHSEYDFALYDEEFRFYDGSFYKPRRISYGSAVSDVFAPIDDAIQGIRNMGNTFTRYIGEPDVPFTEKSIIIGDDIRDCVEAMQEKADRYIFYDKKIWEKCGEPMYLINTFGLGHNHGGTGFFIDYFYNPNISAKNYFRADQYEEAIAYADKVAEGRGDTNDVGRFRDGKYINVLRPEFLSRNPDADHANGGDPFIESIEGAISNTGSVAEAGIIAIAMTMAEIASA